MSESKPDPTRNERQRRLTERRKAAGLVKLVLWLSATDAQAVRELVARLTRKP